MIKKKLTAFRIDLDVIYELDAYLHDRPISRTYVLNDGARLWLRVDRARTAYRKAVDDTEQQEKILSQLLLAIFPEFFYYHQQAALLKK